MRIDCSTWRPTMSWQWARIFLSSLGEDMRQETMWTSSTFYSHDMWWNRVSVMPTFLRSQSNAS